MGRGRGPARWVGPAALALGVLVLAAAGLLFLSLTGDYDPVSLTDRRDMRTVASGAVLGLTLMAYGAYAALGARREAAEGRPDEPARSTGDLARSTGGVAVTPKPAPAPAAAPRPARRGGGVGVLEQVLPGSADALATLRYLAAEAPEALGEAGSELVRRTGPDAWPSARCSARRLAQSGRWWLAFDATRLTDDGLDRLLSVEAALNLGADAEKAGPSAGTAPERARALLARTADLDPVEHPGSRLVADLTAGSRERGEWACRVGVSDAIERLPTPFRLQTSFRLNLSEGLLAVEAGVPRPGAFPFLPEGERAQAACAYAFDLALLLGRTGLEAAASVRRVVVSCRELGSGDVVLSVEIARSSLGRLRALPRERGVPAAEAGLRVAPDGEGWLGAVAPLLALDDEWLCPAGRFRAVELDGSPCPEPLARACGARAFSDLGIAESAARREAWAGVAWRLDGTTAGAVSALTELRDATPDLSVADACARTVGELLSGELDAGDEEAVAERFVDGDPLAGAVRRARALLAVREGDAADELASALGGLEQALAPVDELGYYLDDDASAHRFFGSVAERVAYNLDAADGREVRLVPDAYYHAHADAARLLLALGRPDEALSHAERARELAPLGADAAVVHADCLVALGRLDEAARALAAACERAATVTDAALSLYRLAPVMRALGMEAAALACYQRSIELGGPLAERVRQERDALARASHEALSARRVDPATFRGEKVAQALREAGLPEGRTDALSERLRAAAAACVDAGAFLPARDLLADLLRARPDDVLAGVLGSLRR